MRAARTAAGGCAFRAERAVTLVPRLLAGQLPGIRTLRLSGDVPHRRLYALTPESGARSAALAFAEAVAKAVLGRM